MYKLTNKSKKRSRKSKKLCKRSRRRSKKPCKRSRQKSTKRSRRSKIDGTFGSSGDIQLYTNPSILPSLPIEFCYKDPRADMVACKYKLTEESNPFIITFPGSKKFYKDLENYDKNMGVGAAGYKNMYLISLEDILKMKNLSLKTFILGLKPAFLTKYGSEEIYYDYNRDDIKLIESIVESGGDLFDMSKDGKLILHESLIKKRYDITYFLLSNYGELQANIDDKFIEILTEPNPEIEMMFQQFNECLKSRTKLYYRVKIFLKFLENNGKLIFTLILFVSIFYLLKYLGLIKSKYLVSSINSNSNYIPKLLIYFGADINGYGEPGNIAPYPGKLTPLCKAIKVQNIEIIKFLIKKGVDLDKNCKTFREFNQFYTYPLIEAINDDNFEIVKLLVDNGVNINAGSTTHVNSIPLHRVMMLTIPPPDDPEGNRNSYRIAEYLLKNGADETIRDVDNMTARDKNPEVYDIIKKRVKLSLEIEKIETITTSFVKRDNIEKITDKMEMPEALIEYLKETGVDPSFALDKVLKFVIDTE